MRRGIVQTFEWRTYEGASLLTSAPIYIATSQPHVLEMRAKARRSDWKVRV